MTVRREAKRAMIAASSMGAGTSANGRPEGRHRSWLGAWAWEEAAAALE
jgi:hypothetical protein